MRLKAFRQSEITLGLDLGNTKQYGILLETRRQKAVSHRTFSSTGSLWEDSESLAALLRQIDQLDPEKQAALSLCVTGYPLMLKELPVMPYMKESDLKRFVANEVEQYFNWTTEECLFDFAVLPVTEKQRKTLKQTQVILYAMPKEPIHDLLLRLHQSGRTLQALDLRSNAIYRCLAAKTEPNTYQVILDFTAEPIECSIFRDGLLRRLRNFVHPVSGDFSSVHSFAFPNIILDVAAFLTFYQQETENAFLSELFLLLPQEREEMFEILATELQKLLIADRLSDHFKVISLAALLNQRLHQTAEAILRPMDASYAAAFGLTLYPFEQETKP